MADTTWRVIYVEVEFARRSSLSSRGVRRTALKCKSENGISASQITETDWHMRGLRKQLRAAIFRGGRPYNNTELARLGRVLPREVA